MISYLPTQWYTMQNGKKTRKAPDTKLEIISPEDVARPAWTPQRLVGYSSCTEGERQRPAILSFRRLWRSMPSFFQWLFVLFSRWVLEFPLESLRVHGVLNALLAIPRSFKLELMGAGKEHHWSVYTENEIWLFRFNPAGFPLHPSLFMIHKFTAFQHNVCPLKGLWVKIKSVAKTGSVHDLSFSWHHMPSLFILSGIDVELFKEKS